MLFEAYHAKNFKAAISEELRNRDRKKHQRKMLTRYEKSNYGQRAQEKVLVFGEERH